MFLAQLDDAVAQHGGILELEHPARLLHLLFELADLLVALGLIVISTVLPYLLYTNGLAKVESGKASILASLEPVVASFVGILAFGEPVSLMVFLGLGCILACVYVLR